MEDSMFNSLNKHKTANMKKILLILLVFSLIKIQAQTHYTQPITGTRAYLGQVNNAHLEIRLSTTNTNLQINKPLIVVEGFDSGIMGVENEFGENDLTKFLNGVDFAFGNLPSELNTYDIIYVNWKNGKDDMHRNAYLLEDIIKWVNTEKANAGSTTANVVLGQSMGGVIARFALKDMENQVVNTGSQTWNHKTSLYISHDAPQQGANIPLSVQYFARHIIDQLVSTPLNDININPQDGATVTIDDIKTLLDAPGTKQLLTKTVTSGFVVDEASSTAWQTELRNLGYPQQTRNIAISNGNHCATPQAFAPASELFSLTGNGKTTLLTDMLAMLLQPVANVLFTWAAIEFNEPGLMLGFLPGNSKMDMDFKVKALPTTGTTTEIYKGKITFTKKFIWFNITTALTDRSYNNPSGILSYDYYPGGKYDVPFSFQNSSASNLLLSYGISAVIAENFDFIPTPSALDIGGGGVALTEADYFKKYNAASPPLVPKNSPFVNFTTSFPNGANINENHISFNTRNGNWLATELDNNTSNNQVFDCTYICSDAQITGSDNLCTTATYSVPAVGTSYNWTITQGANLVTLSGNGTKNLTLTKIGSTSGQVTMQVTFGNGICGSGSTTITKTIWVGVPAAWSVSVIGSCESPYWLFKSNVPNQVTSWSYTINGVTNVVYGSEFEISPGDFMSPGQTKILTYQAQNGCGSSGTFSISIKNPRPTDCLDSFSATTLSMDFYKVYPNPTSDIVYIELKDEEQQPSQNTGLVAELYNMMGELKQSVFIINNIASISVNNLPKGIYILKINIDGNIENHQVAVE